MREALDLAERGRGRVEPNPVVGAVIVKDGHVVGRGWHARFGGPHAEVAALASAGHAAAGADAYITLEPCGHEGKTPPCARALVSAGIRRVVYAAPDLNPLTAGRGPRLLEEAGLEISGGLCKAEARALNLRFERHLESDLPWTISKWAMTLDGKIADVEGGSRFITGPESRKVVHEMRGAVDAVAVGVGTVIADDPDLTAREGTVLRPAARLVIDTDLRIPPDARLVATADQAATLIACAPDATGQEELRRAGCRVLCTPRGPGGLDLAALFRALRVEGLARILVEGGGKIHAAAFAAGIVHQVMGFVAPLVLGGRLAPTPVDGPGFARIAGALRLEGVRTSVHGVDVLVEGFVPPGRRSG